MDASFAVSVIWIIFLDNFRELEISILFHWKWSDENLKICSCFPLHGNIIRLFNTPAWWDNFLYFMEG